MLLRTSSLVFLLNDPATTGIYTLSLHDALPIYAEVLERDRAEVLALQGAQGAEVGPVRPFGAPRSEEHTSELQSHSDLVCRLPLEKKNRQRAPDPAVYRAPHARRIPTVALLTVP